MNAFAPFRAALFAILAGYAYAQTPLNLVSQLKDAPTAAERIALLEDSDFVFDFFNPKSGIVTGAGGHTVQASALNFPAVIGNNIAMSIGFLGPCAINTPHTHPRSTEINFSVNGTLRGGLLSENGARFIVSDLQPGTATVFPMGAIHFEMNTGCEPAMFVAAFHNEDPGVLSVAQRYFGLPPDILGATLGGLGVQEVVDLEAKIPDNVAAGTDECLQRCGIARPSQPILQHQPIVSGNAPPGVRVSAPTSAKVNAAINPTPTTSAGMQSRSAAASPASFESPQMNSGTSDNSSSTMSPTLIALIVINSLFAVGLLFAAFMYIKSRSRRSAFEHHKYAHPINPDAMFKAAVQPEYNSTYYDPHPISRSSETLTKQ